MGAKVAKRKEKTRGSVEYLYDKKGKPVKVLMSYDEYVDLLEDIEDLRVSDSRLNEPNIPFEKVVADLKRRGKL